MQVLVFLANHAGDVVSKDELFHSIWEGVPVCDQALSYSICVLRRALGDNTKKPQFIQTIATKGYRLVAPVSVDEREISRDLGSPIRSLAVLAFQNLTGDSKNEYVMEGLTEVLIADLASVPALNVIPQQSVKRYRASDKSIEEIASELNVDAVVEGSVLSAGTLARVIAHLIQARSERHVWSKSYDSDGSEVAGLAIPIGDRLAKDLARVIEEHNRLLAQ